MRIDEIFDLSEMKIIEPDLPLFEMANLDTTDTNLDRGVVFISTKYASHGCRIKFVLNSNEQSKALIVSVPDFEIVLDKLGPKIDDRTRKEVVRFAIKNKDIILDYWNNAATMPRKPYMELLASIQPLTPAEKKSARQLTLKYK